MDKNTDLNKYLHDENAYLVDNGSENSRNLKLLFTFYE